jgi:alpha-galactosidase
VNRIFLICTFLVLGITSCRKAIAADASVAPHLNYGGLDIRFFLDHGKLRESYVLPGSEIALLHPNSDDVKNYTVEMQCTGQDWDAHHARKLIGGNPGSELIYKGSQIQTLNGVTSAVLQQRSNELGLDVESHYQFFDGIPVVREMTRIINHGSAPVGIEHVSSAMLYHFLELGNQSAEQKTIIDYAFNTWMAEAQWHSGKLSQLGLNDNGAFPGLSAISFGNIGSWSTMNYLPMGMVENRDVGLTWFWQIEHNGSWHWEIGRTESTGSYLYLGGPDELYSSAWKQLQPGATYDTVPVALGCVKGGFDEAMAALTAYRRRACLLPHPENKKCSVIFNDYMNCLGGDPSTAKELPLIAAAAKAGCEYFVIDAGWYADPGQSWWDTVGAWQPSQARWAPGGLQAVLDKIKAAGMIPGLWLEIEVAGINSPLKAKPDSWFFMRHGKRVIDHGRFFLDFRNPEVRAYTDEVVDRLVKQYGVGYIKMDYNVDALEGTDANSDSPGQGLLEAQRAFLGWLDGVHARFPGLITENCGSGGGRMDYAMLSRDQLQSASDQEDYHKFPALLVGELAAVLPEQLTGWSYPSPGSDPDEASFNMVTVMLSRILQSGHLDQLKPESLNQVEDGIRVYKKSIRPFLPSMSPFFPLGMPSMADKITPIAVGLRNKDRSFIAAWRLEGSDTITLPVHSNEKAVLLYPSGLGITLTQNGDSLKLVLPRNYMAAIVELTP